MMTKEEAKLVLDNARPQTKEIDRQFYDDEDLNNALDMAIKALELVEEFEKAQIITGGRLNGRTYAYKCGLEDGKRKALEQQPYEEDVQRVVDYLLKPKSKPTSQDCVSRQAVLDLAVDYGTNSATFLIPVCSVKNLPPVTPKLPTSEDCVSRAEVLKQMKEWRDCEFVKMTNPYHYLEKRIQSMPLVTPTQKWIPVSKSLPKENGLYQCTVILNDLPRTMELFYKNGKWLDNRRINMFDTYDIYGYGNTKEKHKLSYQELISEFEWNQVIAWQPLPKPYEGEKND